MARIVVSGHMLRSPVAGMVLAYLHWVLGLERLGHDVVYVEESGNWPDPCFQPQILTCTPRLTKTPLSDMQGRRKSTRMTKSPYAFLVRQYVQESGPFIQ